jgi:NDP-sugar pyrophosphorylase family protein
MSTTDAVEANVPLTLVVLAAGRARRFGGPKQLARVGPSGEVLIAYTIHDALEAGFERIVAVTRAEWADVLQAELEPVVTQRGGRLSMAIQPDRPVDPASERPRAWGTGHAILSAAPLIEGGFAVANGDDWYGPSAIGRLHDALSAPGADEGEHVLVTYPVDVTLGSTRRVTRARCHVGRDGYLQEILELFDVESDDGTIRGRTESGEVVVIPPSTPVSTNLWGFRPTILERLRDRFEDFRAQEKVNAEREFLLPEVVDDLLREGAIRVLTVPAEDRLFGLTRPEDLTMARTRIEELVASGRYPRNLRSD